MKKNDKPRRGGHRALTATWAALLLPVLAACGGGGGTTGESADATYFDLGLCQRVNLAHRGDLCGAFKVPSLRNVALRGAFFHNGRFKTLEDALTFYVQRATDPQKRYPLEADGTVPKFDDLPPEYRVNVNTSEAPYNRRVGDAPALGYRDR